MLYAKGDRFARKAVRKLERYTTTAGSAEAAISIVTVPDTVKKKRPKKKG
jgi:hypothetical protein